MKLMYNKTGAERKALVGAVSEIVGVRAEYQGVPRCGYRIGSYEIDKQGTLIIPAGNTDALERLVTQLDMKGFTYTEREEEEQEAGQMPTDAPESSEPSEEAAEPADEAEATTDAPESSEPEDAAEPSDGAGTITGYVIELPLAGFTDAQLLNLEKLVAGRASLIKKSLGVDELPIVKNDDRLSFPWFRRELTSFEIKTYTHFIAALCETATALKRVTTTDKEVPSERFTFRIFLIKLGFAGPQYADERKLLYKNLSGDCAFNSTAKRDEHAERWKEIRKQRAAQLSNQDEPEAATTADEEGADVPDDQTIDLPEPEPAFLNQEAREDAV